MTETQLQPETPLTIDEDTGNVTPIPRLANLRDVRRELARLYAEARRGDVDPQTATRLAYLLDMIRRVITDADIEDRLVRLEAIHDEQKWASRKR